MLYMVNLTVTIFVLFTLLNIKMKCVQLILNTAPVVLILFFVYLKGFVILVATMVKLQAWFMAFNVKLHRYVNQEKSTSLTL
jgi:hypothetical protein